MKTKISAASLKPKLLMVTQLTELEGTWSRKMNHSDSPRKKSSLRSRTVLMTGGLAAGGIGRAGSSAGQLYRRGLNV